MRDGAFALIDCLGFKGIWKRTDPDLLIDKLRSVVKQVQPQIMKGVPYHLLRRSINIDARILSDSVAISLRYTDPPSKKKIKEEREQNYLVWLICASTIKILDLYLEGEPRIVLRGCVTFGKHTNEENFIVGPAVDEAAENMEVAQGSFVRIHPTAEIRYRKCVETTKETIKILSNANKNENLLYGSKQSLAIPILVDSYPMPLKGGDHLTCPVLNPLAFHDTEDERQAVVQAYKEALVGNDVDILLKQQHTMKFLRMAEEARAAHLAATQEFFDSLKSGRRRLARAASSKT